MSTIVTLYNLLLNIKMSWILKHWYMWGPKYSFSVTWSCVPRYRSTLFMHIPLHIHIRTYTPIYIHFIQDTDRLVQPDLHGMCVQTYMDCAFSLTRAVRSVLHGRCVQTYMDCAFSLTRAVRSLLVWGHNPFRITKLQKNVCESLRLAKHLHTVIQFFKTCAS